MIRRSVSFARTRATFSLSVLQRMTIQLRLSSTQLQRVDGSDASMGKKGCSAYKEASMPATEPAVVANLDAANPLHRSRLVGKELSTYNDMRLYAATPPIEALRLMLHLAATNFDSIKKEYFKIMTNDVSRTYFYAPLQEGQHVCKVTTRKYTPRAGAYVWKVKL